MPEGHPGRLESLGGATCILNATLIIVQNYKRKEEAAKGTKKERKEIDYGAASKIHSSLSL